ncbi:MAG: NifB/NifX family molybdenum-iron cluster-binding protein [Oscillospiraceae bacterium]|nr:NifB/NifX family molybdenum-iron cluster-binding protein [Oscillospiraceae bacterium]
MRIAVAYDNGEIYGHFGHAAMFAVYDYVNADVNQCTKILVDASDRQGHAAMSELMREEKVDAVICGNMGPEAKAALLSSGIVPIVGYCGSADDAADLLILGQLPIDPGEAYGGGCGGGCSCGDACNCGPECGCGCH